MDKNKRIKTTIITLLSFLTVINLSLLIFLLYFQSEIKKVDTKSKAKIEVKKQESKQKTTNQEQKNNSIWLKNKKRLAEQSEEWHWSRAKSLSPNHNYSAKIDSIFDEKTNSYMNWLEVHNIKKDKEKTIFLRRTLPQIENGRGPSKMLGWRKDNEHVVIAFNSSGEDRDIRGFSPYIVNIKTGEKSSLGYNGKLVYDYNPFTETLLLQPKKNMKNKTLTSTLTGHTLGRERRSFSVNIPLQDKERIYAAQISKENKYLAAIVDKPDQPKSDRLLIGDIGKNEFRQINTGKFENSTSTIKLKNADLEIDHWYHNSVFRYYLLKDGEKKDMRQETRVLFEKSLNKG